VILHILSLLFVKSSLISFNTPCDEIPNANEVSSEASWEGGGDPGTLHSQVSNEGPSEASQVGVGDTPKNADEGEEGH
jgi:hypothetical protein